MATPRKQIAEMLSKPETNQEPEREIVKEDAQPTPEPGEEVEAQKLEEAEPQPGQKDEQSGDDDIVEYLTDLAPHLDIDPEQLYALKLKPSEGGEPLTLGEAKDIVQEYNRRKGEFDQNLTRIQELEREREQLQHTQQSQQQAQAQINELDEEGQKAWQQMTEAHLDFERINWEELEKVDPGRAALEQQKLLRKHGTAKKAVMEAQQRMNQTRNAQYQEYKYLQDQELLKRVPEWKDPNRVQEDVNGIINWARTNYQLSDPEIGQVIDWRHRDMMRKAYLYDQLQTKKDEIETQAPAQIRGGIRLKKTDVNARKVKDLVTKARSGGKADKTAAARAVLDQAFAK